jgi:benzoyl-CoA reductase/2-hydroxyglutaryl-CoA dehydratase subunit BcrC/BadD/HgdB
MCDLWAFEQYMLANLLREKDIPSLELEINYLMDSVGQVRTRVQAFVENLPRRSA